MRSATTPDTVPLLSRGRHRSPRQGACFMELASVLAGERWSDHPRCTHPGLAHLARRVNDAVSDDVRSGLAHHVPGVIGLTSTGPRWDLEIASVAARAALPLAVGADAEALAAGLITVERALAALEGRAGIRPEAAAVLADAPAAAAWAERFVASLRPPRPRDVPGGAVVDLAVRAVETAPVDRARRDAVLLGMLLAALDRCRSLAAAAVATSGAGATPAHEAPAAVAG